MRGQITQLFIFLAALLVIGASIFLGSKLIGGVTSTACKANDAAFQKELSRLLDDNSVQGSRDEVVLASNCDAYEVCFVDVRDIGKSSYPGSDPFIKTAVEKGVKTNIYLKSDEGTTEAGFDERIIIRSPSQTTPVEPKCVNAVGGKFHFNAEGYGRYVKITPIA